jgi:hypothetical protein
MSGLESATAMLTLPWWAGLAFVVLLAVFCALAFLRAGLRQTLGAVARYSVAVLALIVAVGFLERFAARDRAAEQRILEARMGELTARAIAPGSPLACLDATAGETVESACERALFVSPETIAAAVAYVSARLALLADAVAFARPGQETPDSATAALRHAAETDRFGFVAHVLAYRDNCTPAVCDAFKLLRDSSRIAANMRARTFDTLVERYAAGWSARETPAEPAAPETSSAPVASVPAPGAPMAAHYDFPSAASIPPVSIMNAEPGSPPGPAAAETASEPAGARRQAAPPPRRATAGAARPGTPVPIAPPSPPAAANAAPGAAVR